MLRLRENGAGPGVAEQVRPSGRRRTLQRIDADALDRVLHEWVASPQRLEPGNGTAVDGKVLRGAWDAMGRQAHVFAAILHGQGWCWGSGRLRKEAMSIRSFSVCWGYWGVQGKVVTAEVLHAQKTTRGSQ